MNSWFEVKCKYTRQYEDGRLKRVTEPYLIDAMSFTEAESRAFEEVGNTTPGEFLITAIKRENFADIFAYDDADDWYKCVVKYVTVDEDSGKERSVANNFLLTAESVKQATERIHESLSDMMADYEVTSVSLTPIVEVMPYVSKPELA